MSPDPLSLDQLSLLSEKICIWSRELGFQETGFSDIDLSKAEQHLEAWLEKQYHGSMQYMFKHGRKRSRPDRLIPGTLSIISVRMNYLAPSSSDPWKVLETTDAAYISRYALGRDYHKLMRSRLKKLAQLIQQEVGSFAYRVFTDSAPVLEKAIAEKAGLGWRGKHSNLLTRDQGSWFFLGEIYTDLPLPVHQNRHADHCGSCTACIDICPTQAIVKPYTVDARLCISYLTIESKEAIPVALRPALGNRIYGCDDCQLICPWNRFAQLSCEQDFSVRHKLDQPDLLELFNWTEEEFLRNTEGSAIRRIGYVCWTRNLSVALGNALAKIEDKNSQLQILHALHKRKAACNTMVQEHITWAEQQAVNALQFFPVKFRG